MLDQITLKEISKKFEELKFNHDQGLLVSYRDYTDNIDSYFVILNEPETIDLEKRLKDAFQYSDCYIVSILDLSFDLQNALQDTQFDDIIEKVNRHTLYSNYKEQDMKENQEAVNHPTHYNMGKIEVIDYIEDHNFNFNLGNAIKYISRCEHKGKKVEDLKKAVWYIKREIKRIGGNE